MPDYRRPVAVKFQKTPPAGNRVYTDLREDELYVAVPGKDLATIADEVETIATANAKLSEYRRGRRQDWRRNSGSLEHSGKDLSPGFGISAISEADCVCRTAGNTAPLWTHEPFTDIQEAISCR